MNTGTRHVLMLVVSLTIFLTMAGIWAVDIGVSIQSVTCHYPDMQLVATNGWNEITGIQQYHRGLYLTIVSVMLMAFVTVYAVFRGLE